MPFQRCEIDQSGKRINLRNSRSIKSSINAIVKRFDFRSVFVRIAQNDFAGFVLRSHDVNSESVEFGRLVRDALLQCRQARAGLEVAIVAERQPACQMRADSPIVVLETRFEHLRLAQLQARVEKYLRKQRFRIRAGTDHNPVYVPLPTIGTTGVPAFEAGNGRAKLTLQFVLLFQPLRQAGHCSRWINA